MTLDGEQLKPANVRSFRIPVTAGPHTIGAALVDRTRGAGVDEQFSDFRVNSAFTAAGGIQTVVVTGPFKATSAGDTPSRHRIFVCQPSNAADEASCAKKIVSTTRTPRLSPAGDRRRSRDADEVLREGPRRRRLRGRHPAGARAHPRRAGVSLSRRNRTGGGTARRALPPEQPRSRVASVLLPLEQHPGRRTAGLSRAKGTLRDPKVLQQQVKRMLADPKSEALTNNFAGQWLFLRDLAHVQTSATNFDDNLRQSFRTETEMLFANVVHEDESLLTLLNANYTFVDERLAKHYGIPEHPRQLLPPRRPAGRQPAPRPARPGQHPHRDVSRDADVAGHARPLDSREPARHAGADSTAWRRHQPREESRGSEEHVAAAPARSAPHEPDVRVVPQDHGPDRLRARELRPRRHVARRRRTDRRWTRPASSWTARS